MSILFLGHYFVYVSVLYFFGIIAFEHRTALAVVLFLLPLSFIASSFLAHWSDGLLTRVLYFCSSLWLGVGLTLLTAFVFAWAAWGATAFSAETPTRVVRAGRSGTDGSVLRLWCRECLPPAHGELHRSHQESPPGWQGKKLVQLSDVHLGRILGADFLSRIVAKVNAQNPAMVLITGDLFDGADGNLEELVAPLNRLVAPQGIYFVTGNHETYLGVQRSYAALRTTPVRVLADERVVVDGLQVIGISYPERGHALGLRRRWPSCPASTRLCPRFCSTTAPPKSRRRRRRASTCSFPATFIRAKSSRSSSLPG